MHIDKRFEIGRRLNQGENISKNEMIVTISNIKQDVLNSRNRIAYNANRELINLYFRIGKIINQNLSMVEIF